jgi:hypothetical protein
MTFPAFIGVSYGDHTTYVAINSITSIRSYPLGSGEHGSQVFLINGERIVTSVSTNDLAARLLEVANHAG